MKRIEFFWDVGSPYTYLAMTQIPAMRARTGAELVLRPFLLGGVFKATGNHMIDVAAKAKNMVDDLSRWARLYGVPMRVPGRDEVPFPINSLSPMRAATAAMLSSADEGDRVAFALMDAYWARGLDLSDKARLAEVVDARWIAAAEAQPTKDALRKNTEEAVARGAFGAPSFFVGEQLFWGNDRLAFAEAAAAAG